MKGIKLSHSLSKRPDPCMSLASGQISPTAVTASWLDYPRVIVSEPSCTEQLPQIGAKHKQDSGSKGSILFFWLFCFLYFFLRFCYCIRFFLGSMKNGPFIFLCNTWQNKQTSNTCNAIVNERQLACNMLNNLKKNDDATRTATIGSNRA